MINHLSHLIGTVLEADLVDAYGAILIPKDKVVTVADVEKAAKHPLLGQIPSVKKTAGYGDVIRAAVGELTEIFESVRYRDRIPLRDVQLSILPHVHHIVGHPNLSQLLNDLRSQDQYTVCHSFAVSILSTLIGRWMGMGSSELAELTTAAILHDIGKMKIPLSILNKPGKLTPDEYAEMQKHTVYGYELIQNTVGTSHHQALAALQHHERLDGSGYPFGLSEDKMCLFAKIIGIADVFHAMGSKRVYHDSAPLYQVLEELYAGMFGKFEPKILLLLLRKFMNALVGSSVTLSDGRRGEIVMVHPTDPIHPLVKVGDEFLDLRNGRFHLQQVGS